MAELRPVNWDFALIRQDPFPTTPPRRPDEAVWAGFTELKSQLNSLFVEGLTTARTQVVLNRGEYGSGKTHAAIYFGRQDRLPAVKGQQVKDTWIFYIQTPKEPEQADKLLYRSIIEAVRFRRLREVIQGIIADYGSQSALEKLQVVAESEALGKALWLMGHERVGPGQLSMFEQDKASEDWQRLLESYFFSQTTKSDLRQLELSRPIDTARDRFLILGGLLQCLIGLAPTEEIEHHNRVILWIDELEDLIYYTTRQYRPFTQGLRELIDRLPSYFTLMMNFTLASPEALQDIETVLGKAILDRVTHQVYFREPTQDEAVEYVRELLGHYRVQQPDVLGLPVTYPFEEEALRTLIAGLPTRTPRDINQACADTVREALQRGVISAPGQGIIDREFVRALGTERIEFDMR